MLHLATSDGIELIERRVAQLFWQAQHLNSQRLSLCLKEVRALQTERGEAREGLRALPGRYRKRRHGETETMSDEESGESLKAKTADLERRLTEATRTIGEKGKELATT